MLVDESLVDTTRLLLQQRLQLVQSRYVGLQQLRQHDLKLIANIKLIFQREITTKMPRWLNWLANKSTEPLLLLDLNEFIKVEAAWVLLHELKVLLQPEWLAMFIAHNQQNNELEPLLFWPLAIRLQLKLDPFSFMQPVNTAALWYIVCSAQPALQAKLHVFITTLAKNDPLIPHVKIAIYSYNNSTLPAKQVYCEANLIQQLVDTAELQPEQLMLLLTAAVESKQNDIVNLLINNSQTQTLAILALAIIGKTKFLALLIELTQQSDTSEVATDSLACILGVIEADTLLCDVKQLAMLNLNASTKYLAGHSLSSATLAQIWQQGNQLQRRIAACYARLNDNNISWRDPDTLLGGAWHNQ